MQAPDQSDDGSNNNPFDEHEFCGLIFRHLFAVKALKDIAGFALVCRASYKAYTIPRIVEDYAPDVVKDMPEKYATMAEMARALIALEKRLLAEAAAARFSFGCTGPTGATGIAGPTRHPGWRGATGMVGPTGSIYVHGPAATTGVQNPTVTPWMAPAYVGVFDLVGSFGDAGPQ